MLVHHYHGRIPPPADPDGPVDESAEFGEELCRRLQLVSADLLCAEIRAAGGRAAHFDCDLAARDAVPGLFDAAERLLGPVDILVNNVAHWECDTLLNTSDDLVNRMVEEWTSAPQRLTAGSFDRHFAVNARAVALAMAEFAARHRRCGAGWGRIINVSPDGAHCFPSEVSSGASKLAPEGLSRSAAQEFGLFGITVNIVSPGPIQTVWITPSMERQLAERCPLRRVGRPEDVADVIAFLASDEARQLTGQLLHVGGGHAM